MKSLFECIEKGTRLELGREENNNLLISLQNEILQLPMHEAIIFQNEVSKYIEEMKAVHRSRLPWWRGLRL
jgi:hypothetical protein